MRRFITAVFLTFAAASAQTFSFQTAVTYPAQQGPLSTATADFNGDGNLDLAVANASSSSVSIFQGNGDGTFTNTATVAIPGSCSADHLIAGDFNNDKKIDLLVICALQTTVWVLPGLGTGQFGTPIASALPGEALYGWVGPFNTQNLAVADFNSDGFLDLVVGTFPSSGEEVVLLLGKGNGAFQPATVLQSIYFGGSIVTADFNRDGYADLALEVVTLTSSGTAVPGGLMILLGDGKGNFQPGKTYSLPGTVLIGCMIVANVNGDSDPDLVVASAAPEGEQAQPYLTVFTGNGDGTFTQAFNETETGTTLFGMVAADFRGIGRIDLLEEKAPIPPFTGGLLVGNLSMTIRPGNGDGTFQAPVAISLPSSLSPFFSPFWFSMAVGDWNGDGQPDLAFTASPPSTLVPGTLVSKADQTNYQVLPEGDLVVMVNTLPLTVPEIVLTTPQLQFASVAGGANPPSQSLTLSNGGAGTLNWTAASSAPWLTVTPKSGTGTAALTLSASAGSLPAAVYTATISIAAAGAVNSPKTITVTFTIVAPSNQPVITGVVNGASFQPGIESGSWVTIQGSNLSNTNPGRTWTSSEIVNGNLPTSLDNTSVTIDGKPAFVYYISPTQLNVQAPTDSATGSVSLVVTNNGQVSAPFSAQLASAAPAFFLYSGTSYAIAQHYPDYADVGNPNVISYTIAAHPGDVLILWATGFGATSPPTSAGVEVTGAPAVATAPTIAVGGAPVSVISAVLSPGSAGLYQIAIQLPASVPTGVVAIQASVGGALSPAGISIYVSAQ